MTKLHLTVTDTPTALKAVTTACKTVQLSWSAPVNNTPPVAGYEVFFTISGSDKTQSGGITTSTTIALVLPLLDVTTYDLFVVAYSDAANALPSVCSNNITVDMGKLKFLMSITFYLLLTIVQCLNIHYIE